MIVNVSYDASVSTAPAAFKTDVAAVVAYLASQFSDNITFDLHVGFGEVHGATMSSGFLGQSFVNFNSYTLSQITTALGSDAGTPDDSAAVATLPASDPDPSASWLMTDPQAKALGLISNASTVTAWVGFAKPASTFDFDRSDGIDANKYDFIGTVAHEITEVMGRFLGANTDFDPNAAPDPFATPLDLFDYSAPHTRLFARHGYFSFDDGVTNLDPFNILSGANAGDPADWAPGAGNDSFRNNSNPGVYNNISVTDLRLMDVIGWDRVIDDYGADTNFAGLVRVNNSQAGSIDNGTDHDWVRVRLVAGTHYSISVSGADTSGGTLADPLMNIYDDNATLLITRDNSSATHDPHLVFTPHTTGFYYIDVSGVGGATGSYTVNVAVPLTAVLDQASVEENTTAAATITDTTDSASGPLSYTISGGDDAALFAIDPASGALSFVKPPDFYAPADANHDNRYAVTVTASDGAFFSDDIGVLVTVTEAPHLHGTAADDSFAAMTGNERIDAGTGIDTVSFTFKLTDAVVSFAGNHVIVDGPGSHTVLSGIEVYKFTDGTVTESASDPLVDDLYYYSQNHDVWLSGADAATHYHAVGWHEGRDPNAFFSTSTYLSLHPAVKAAGLDPLRQFDQNGWQAGNDPSVAFDTNAYLAANPDIKAAGVDPLAQLLLDGAQEGRQPIAPAVLIAPNGFDYVYYLQHNPDVAAAHIDPLAHYQTTGWKEGRNPNGYFDDVGYLAHNGDVAAAGINPLDHYDQFGWREGRDPSVSFDTKAYLSHYPDIAAAGIDPLVHFLQHGLAEGRSAFGDGVWS